MARRHALGRLLDLGMSGLPWSEVTSILNGEHALTSEGRLWRKLYVRQVWCGLAPPLLKTIRSRNLHRKSPGSFALGNVRRPKRSPNSDTPIL